jgi:signal peptidase I
MTEAPITPEDAEPPSVVRRAGRWLGSLFVAACVLIAAIMLVPPLFGYERYVITSGSMTGTYDKGSVIFDDVVPTTSLRLGDVITYKPPPGAGPRGKVTHRIVRMKRARDGATVYRTKGDANDVVDPWTFRLDNPKQARVKFHVPYVGWVYAALNDRRSRLFVVGLPALLVAMYVFFSFFREAGEEMKLEREREAEADDTPDEATSDAEPVPTEAATPEG